MQMRALGGTTAGSVWGCTCAGHACHLATTLMLMGALGPDRFGYFAFSVTVLGVLGTVGGLGLRQVVVREVVRRPEAAGRLSTAYLVLTGGAWIALTTGVLAWVGLARGPTDLPPAGILAAGGFALCASLQPLFDSRGLQAAHAVVALAADIAALAAVAAATATGRANLEVAVGVVAAKPLLVWAGAAALLRGHGLRPRFGGWTREAGPLIRSARPLLASVVAGVVPGAVIAATLEGAAGSAAFAQFAVGTQAASAYLLLVIAGVRVLHPGLCLRAGGDGGRRSPGRELTTHGALMLGSLVGTAGAGLFLVTVVLGPGYRGALGPMTLLLVGAFLNGLGQTAAAWLVAVGREAPILHGQLVGAAVAVFGCWTGGHAFSPLGAALLSCTASGLTAAVVITGVCRGPWRPTESTRHPGGIPGA